MYLCKQQPEANSLLPLVTPITITTYTISNCVYATLLRPGASCSPSLGCASTPQGPLLQPWSTITVPNESLIRLTTVRHRSSSQSTARMMAKSDANCSKCTACVGCKTKGTSFFGGDLYNNNSNMQKQQDQTTTCKTTRSNNSNMQRQQHHQYHLFLPAAP